MGPIADDVAFHARFRPDAAAALDAASGRSWSYREFDLEIGRLAALFRQRGLRAGDRVASLARNSTLLVAVHLACARLGLIYVPLNWRLSEHEIEALIASAGPALILHDDQPVTTTASQLRLEEATAAAAALDLWPAAAPDADRPSLILFTSGTTGRPKGVVLSEANLAETAANFTQLGAVSARSAMLIDAPMFHILGLVTTVRSAIACGARIVVSPGFDAGTTLARLADPSLAITHYFAVPQMLAALRGHPAFRAADLAGLTALFSGGAPLPADDLWRWLDDGIVIANGYGMSECGTITGMPPDIAIIRDQPASAGVPTARIGLRLMTTEGRIAAIDEAGEAQVRGPAVTSGYWRQPDETAAAFTTDGWFRTGDIATLDAEGHCTILGRLKDMYISGGENVYPAEVEAALVDLPGALAVAVVGMPDEKWGEVGHLAIVADTGATIGIDQVHAHLDGRLARYKFPLACTVVADIPRTASGKIRKGELRVLLGG